MCSSDLHLDDALWPQIEVLDDQRRERVVGHLPGALGCHHDAGGARHADGVGQLHQAPRREAGGDDILGDVARRVRRGAVDLGGILAGEGAAAMRRRAAVGVDDDLAAGDSAVALRPADLERAGRVDEVQIGRASCRERV